MQRRKSIGIHPSRAGLLAGIGSCLLATSPALATPPLPLSVLVLDQSASLRPWSSAIIKAIQSSMSGDSAKRISYYVEHLDLFDFYSPRYEDNLRNHFSDKYRDKPIGLIISIGPDALDFAMKLRAVVWPAVPVASTAVDEEVVPKNRLPPRTTGMVIRRSHHGEGGPSSCAKSQAVSAHKAIASTSMFMIAILLKNYPLFP
jgi:hypothetical protein